jgi:hypothetical protein
MGGSFRGLNASQSRCRNHVPFRDPVLPNERDSFLRERDATFSHRRSRAERFRRDVDHLRAPVGCDVSEPFHPPIATIIRPGW